MKIYDLIAILEQFDPKMEVTVWNDSCGERSEDLHFGINFRDKKPQLHIDTVIVGEPAKYIL